ncbi:MAG: pyruvate kinase, partial [Gemmatimonadota bacterium]
MRRPAAGRSTLRTKIVATVGPSTSARDKVHALAELGVDVVRVNFAHAGHEEAANIIAWVREASA